MAKIRRCIVSEESVTAPLWALDNEAVLAENSLSDAWPWVLVEDVEDGMEDSASRDSRNSMSITSTSPVVDKAAILPGSSSQE